MGSIEEQINDWDFSRMPSVILSLILLGQYWSSLANSEQKI